MATHGTLSPHSMSRPEASYQGGHSEHGPESRHSPFGIVRSLSRRARGYGRGKNEHNNGTSSTNPTPAVPSRPTYPHYSYQDDASIASTSFSHGRQSKFSSGSSIPKYSYSDHPRQNDHSYSQPPNINIRPPPVAIVTQAPEEPLAEQDSQNSVPYSEEHGTELSKLHPASAEEPLLARPVHSSYLRPQTAGNDGYGYTYRDDPYEPTENDQLNAGSGPSGFNTIGQGGIKRSKSKRERGAQMISRALSRRGSPSRSRPAHSRSVSTSNIPDRRKSPEDLSADGEDVPYRVEEDYYSSLAMADGCAFSFEDFDYD